MTSVRLSASSASLSAVASTSTAIFSPARAGPGRASRRPASGGIGGSRISGRGARPPSSVHWHFVACAGRPWSSAAARTTPGAERLARRSSDWRRSRRRCWQSAVQTAARCRTAPALRSPTQLVVGRHGAGRSSRGSSRASRSPSRATVNGRQTWPKPPRGVQVAVAAGAQTAAGPLVGRPSVGLLANTHSFPRRACSRRRRSSARRGRRRAWRSGRAVRHADELALIAVELLAVVVVAARDGAQVQAAAPRRARRRSCTCRPCSRCRTRTGTRAGRGGRCGGLPEPDSLLKQKWLGGQRSLRRRSWGRRCRAGAPPPSTS